ncbi:hypothetical protein VOLCADRAFT_120868 [Volvox carteri f. nagariensis]|uniref:Uncharacterized protein mot6 n=1 Tax=Volvox carteri f. nagariensis TaxID=3068 RepID=D8TV52_VOLCA|nr:uncharacterized protein VOLCADRAFT_120868 [Volvox carteri f. nagariensis]EFJ48516.1 hypothetical protein VOLCADRAFT_120868 [Volvox carteri f. nagariensis]|eukprot:XP_002950315.1 hypothetical protein VOLCADRAFT_120868 [Volvox carteri f. nagariensis]
MSALNPARNATRVQAPPGGHSSISLYGDVPSPSKAPPTSPPEADPAAEQPGDEVAEVSEVEQAVPLDDAPAMEVLKLQAIGAIAAATDAPDVREAISTMLKQLQISSEAQAAKAAAEAAPEPAPVEDEDAKKAEVALAAFKAALKLRGTHGIISVGKKFRSMDDDGNHKLTYDEFKKGLHELKLHLSEADLMRLFRRFDRDASGFISFDELLEGLRGELSERRLDMVKRCFKVLDTTGDGKVSLADLERRYDASRHPDVIAGVKSQRMVLLEFLGVFESAGGGAKGDGQVDFNEFKTYYTLISANIDEGKSGDDYFELMMRNVWHVSGGEGWCANTSCKRVLVVLEDDSQKVVEVTDDFDVDVKDPVAVKAKLVEQGLKGIKNVALYGDMNVPSSPSPATPADATASPRIGRRMHFPEHVKSSIVFG